MHALLYSLPLVVFSMYSLIKLFLISWSRPLQWSKNFWMLKLSWHSLSKLMNTLYSSMGKCGDKSGRIFRRKWWSTAEQPHLWPHWEGWSDSHQWRFSIQRMVTCAPELGQFALVKSLMPSTGQLLLFLGNSRYHSKWRDKKYVKYMIKRGPTCF